jgi:hypothetical protein
VTEEKFFVQGSSELSSIDHIGLNQKTKSLVFSHEEYISKKKENGQMQIKKL